ncbi:methylated-DNA--[protein]-cysteine S-methyltransferase [Sphingosinicella sp.]|uniref:methylated-DNA--[protein]-cysteine S-methyltransferase n=1 Tax=Sphingosinicella sp. TaxID=1917971 RepID=UPI004037B1A8
MWIGFENEMRDGNVVETAALATPLGGLHVFALAGDIVAVEFEGRNYAAAGLMRWFSDLAFEKAYDPIRITLPFVRYFCGEPDPFANIRVRPFGTAFQRAVWAQIQQLKRGEVVSYVEIARRIGQPAAARAVGQANGANPVPIIIPCHRTIGSNGSLTGYGSGLDRKRWLLNHEGAVLPPSGTRVGMREAG